MKSPRGKCECCVNFTKVGDQHNRWFLCEAFDWRSASSCTYKSCKYFKRKKFSKRDRKLINNYKGVDDDNL